jgi:hypothetical protein
MTFVAVGCSGEGAGDDFAEDMIETADVVEGEDALEAEGDAPAQAGAEADAIGTHEQALIPPLPPRFPPEVPSVPPRVPGDACALFCAPPLFERDPTVDCGCRRAPGF